MARANRHYVPGLTWHITHRCHKREFLLKFAKDRRRWLFWLFTAKKRYGLCILNYTLTSNHIHLLVYDNKKRSVISRSIDLIAGRSAQEFNERKKRHGAYWEDRYHATAIENDSHLFRCMVYIDMNMVRAGIVKHPAEWPFCGYNEILGNRKRFTLINVPALMNLMRINSIDELKATYTEWIKNTLDHGKLWRESLWTESVAVGSQEFVKRTAVALGIRSRGKKLIDLGGTWELREEKSAYRHLFQPLSRHLR